MSINFWRVNAARTVKKRKKSENQVLVRVRYLEEKGWNVTKHWCHMTTKVWTTPWLLAEDHGAPAPNKIIQPLWITLWAAPLATLLLKYHNIVIPRYYRARVRPCRSTASYGGLSFPDLWQAEQKQHCQDAYAKPLLLSFFEWHFLKLRFQRPIAVGFAMLIYSKDGFRQSLEGGLPLLGLCKAGDQ